MEAFREARRVSERRRRSRLSFFRKKDGSVSIEFVVLAPIFFTLAFGVIEIALISLGTTGVRAGLSDVGRQIRTGQAQCLNEQQVAESVCQFALVAYCTTDMEVEQSVIGDGVSTSVDSIDELNAGDIVFMQATYPWRIINPALFPFLGDEDGTLQISSSIVFKSESFDDQACS